MSKINKILQEIAPFFTQKTDYTFEGNPVTYEDFIGKFVNKYRSMYPAKFNTYGELASLLIDKVDLKKEEKFFLKIALNNPNLKIANPIK